MTSLCLLACDACAGKWKTMTLTKKQEEPLQRTQRMAPGIKPSGPESSIAPSRFHEQANGLTQLKKQAPHCYSHCSVGRRSRYSATFGPATHRVEAVERDEHGTENRTAASKWSKLKKEQTILTSNYSRPLVTHRAVCSEQARLSIALKPQLLEVDFEELEVEHSKWSNLGMILAGSGRSRQAAKDGARPSLASRSLPWGNIGYS